MATGAAYICDWCDMGSTGLDLSCPGCGAPVEVEKRVGPSGWQEVPGMSDMARLELGRSSVQIEVLCVPVDAATLDAGNICVRRLAEGEAILLKPSALLFKDPSVEMHLHFDYPGNRGVSGTSWSERYVWIRLYGPGRVAIQSAGKHLHHEETGGSVSGSSPRTEWQPFVETTGAIRPSIPWMLAGASGAQYGPMRLDQVKGYE